MFYVCIKTNHLKIFLESLQIAILNFDTVESNLSTMLLSLTKKANYLYFVLVNLKLCIFILSISELLSKVDPQKFVHTFGVDVSNAQV